MHIRGTKKEKRYGKTAGGKKVVEIMKKALPKDEVVEVKIYSLCSEGNRRIVQSSYDRNRLQNIADMLNQEAELMTGVKYEKFYLLEPL